MKKIMLGLFFVLSLSMQAQLEGGDLRIGAHLGVPIASTSDFAGFNFGFDASYMFYEPIENLEIGAATGYTHFTGKDREYTYVVDGTGQVITTEVSVGSFGFIPIAGAARYNFTDQFFAGLDLGFGIATSDISGGFYYQPKGGWKSDAFEAFIFLKGITSGRVTVNNYSTGGSAQVFGVGAAYKFDF